MALVEVGCGRGDTSRDSVPTRLCEVVRAIQRLICIRPRSERELSKACSASVTRLLYHVAS